jgi:hypothetical protein
MRRWKGDKRSMRDNMDGDDATATTRRRRDRNK